MARMHSHKRGRSGSKRPASKSVPQWVDYSAPDVEEMVVKFAKEGTPPSQIGLRMRDAYGIPSVRNITGKSIVEIMKAAKLKYDYPEDILSLIKRAVNMRRHLEKNRTDVHNKVKLIHTEAKIKRLGEYYSRAGILPADWRYEPEKAALLVK